MTGRLQDKRAIVTGAGSGIGEATARRFAREGACVAAFDRDEQRLDALVEQLRGAGGDVEGHAVDVTDEAALSAAIDAFAKRAGGLDVVVANAGIFLMDEDARADELETGVWQRVLDVNLTGVFLTCKHGIRHLLASGGGAVICTGSPDGQYGIAPSFDAYSASKGGVYGLVRVMAKDYGADGIRVNAVFPGFTATPLVDRIMADEAEREILVRQIPLGRPGTADEVANVMLFLASAEASYVTGAGWYVDGGITAV